MQQSEEITAPWLSEGPGTPSTYAPTDCPAGRTPHILGQGTSDSLLLCICPKLCIPKRWLWGHQLPWGLSKHLAQSPSTQMTKAAGQ